LLAFVNEFEQAVNLPVETEPLSLTTTTLSADGAGEMSLCYSKIKDLEMVTENLVLHGHKKKSDKREMEVSLQLLCMD